MRLKSIDLTCPKCKKSPKLKRAGSGKVLKCTCQSTGIYLTFTNVLKAWILILSESGSFKGYDKIIIDNDSK